MIHTKQFFINSLILKYSIIHINVFYSCKFYTWWHCYWNMKLTTADIGAIWKDKTPQNCSISRGYDIRVCYGSSDINGHQYITEDWTDNSKPQEAGQVRIAKSSFNAMWWTKEFKRKLFKKAPVL